MRHYTSILTRLKNVENMDPLLDFIRGQILKDREKSVSTVIAEDVHLKTAVPEDVTGQYEGKATTQGYADVVFRWKLELAKSDPATRKELTGIVASYKTDSGQALSLISVISYERWYFLNDEGVRDNIFYRSFKDALKEACVYFITQYQGLSADQLLSVGAILIDLSERDFTIRVPQLLKEFPLEQEDKFFACLLLCFFCAEFNETPLKASKLLELAVQTEEQGNRKIIINSILHHMRLQDMVLKRSKHKMLYSYRELRTTVHTLIQRIEGLNYDLRAEEVDECELRKNWLFLKDEFRNYQRALDGFLAGDMSEKTRVELSNSVIQLEISLNEIDRVMQRDKIENEDLHIAQKYLVRLGELISGMAGSNSITTVLDRFGTDVLKICYQVLSQEKNAMKEAGKDADYTPPKVIKQAFGEEFYIVPIFKNIVENARKHSRGSRLQIDINVNDEEEVLDILFLDDGEFPEIYEVGHGLEVVNSNVSRCGGEFTLGPFTEANLYFDTVVRAYGKVMFRTVAHLRLPYIHPTYAKEDN